MGDSATTAPHPVCLNGLATDLWPRTARLEAGGDISVGGVPLSTLAAQYGTPAYILDEADVRDRCRTYADALPGAEIAYAAKAFWCRAMAGWIAREGLSLDVCSAGELAVARSVRFGFCIASGDAADAVRKAFAHPELELVGLHCHLGTQLTELRAYELAAARLVQFMAAVRNRYGVALAELNLGGGHAVPYLAGEESFSPAGFADRIRRVLKAECAARRLPLPRLTVEPGRAIVSRAMVTLYHVIAVKHVPGARALVAVDGGMSDNPRPALYGARYTVRALRPPDAALEPMTVTGRYCEAGDVLAVDVPLPADTRPGDRDAYAHQGAARSRAAARAPQPCAAATPFRPDSGPSARPLVLPAEGLRP